MIRRREKGCYSGLDVLGFFIEIMPFEVIGSGSLVGIECRAIEGDGSYNLAMGRR